MMQDVIDAFAAAAGLILGFDDRLAQIVLLSLRVTLTAVGIAMVIGLPLGAMLTMTAAFGYAHGWAHGAEGPAAGLAAYAAGFAVATLALHGVGIGAARILERGTALRALGGGTAAAGLALAMVG